VTPDINITDVRAERDVYISVWSPDVFAKIVAHANGELRRQWICGYRRVVLDENERLTIQFRQRYGVIRALGGGEYPLWDGDAPSDDYLGAAEAANWQLLILGEPGAGKTIALLDIADALSSSPENKLFVFAVNIGGWNTAADPVEWLANAIAKRYGLRAGDVRALLHEAAGNVVLLLDGFDDVAPDLQRRVVEALNSVTSETPVGLIMTCRTADYLLLGAPLRLNAAIELLPLGDNRNTAPAINEETAADLTRTPLFASLARLTNGGDAPLQNDARTLGALWEAFIERPAIQEPGIPKTPSPSLSTTAVTNSLAQLVKIQRAREAGLEIYPEELDVTWLQEPTVHERALRRLNRWQGLYLVIPWSLSAFLVFFLCTGPIVGGVGFVGAIIVGIIALLVMTYVVLSTRKDRLENLGVVNTRLTARVAFGWPWRPHGKKWSDGLALAMTTSFGCFFVGLELVLIYEQDRGSTRGFWGGFGPVVVFTLLGAIFVVVAWLCLDLQRFRPGEASLQRQLRACLRARFLSALLYSTALGLAGGLAVLFATTPSDAIILAAWMFATFLGVIGLVFPLGAFAQDWTTYRVAQRGLIELGVLPTKGLDAVLEEARRRGLVVRVGHGWQYRHATLAAYLVSRNIGSAGLTTDSSRPQPA
jgi:hypothetical protein